MAIKYIKGNNPLGSLGSLALVGGTLTGNPFLSALGSGIGAANKIFNGNGNNDTVGAFEEAIRGIKGWINPAQGNIAQPGDYSNVLDYLRKNGGF